MPSTLLFITLQCISITSYAQIKTYYFYVNAAESAIRCENLKTADSLYQIAFDIKKAFRRDAINALIVKMKINDTTYIPELFANLDKGGKNYLTMHINDSANKKWFVECLDRFSKTATELKYDRLFNEILMKDQQVRYKDFCKGYLYTTQHCEQEKKRTDSLNSKQVCSLLKEGALKYSVEAENAIYIVALHNSQWGNYSIHTHLKKKVISGQFDARVYAELMDQIPKNDREIYFGTNSHLILNDSLYFLDSLEIEVRERVDCNRNKLFLRPYLDSEAFLIWKLKTNQPYLFGQAYRMNFSVNVLESTINQILANKPNGQIIELEE